MLLTAILLLSASFCTLQAQMKKGQIMEQRARELISQMTVDEKIGQLMNDAPGIERLGLKPYNWWGEALHGVGRTGRATVFPEPIGLGATFDPALLHAIGDVISTEARAKFNIAQQMQNYGQYAGLTFWAPNVNIFRDPRWGRGMETYGEDPFLTGTLGVAYVRGMQGDDPFYLKAAACGKHFAVHSGPELTRHEANVEPTRRDLYATYLPAFKMLVQEGKVEIIMGAYNALYGESCSGSKLLLTDILRHDWGFRGHIVSDCGAVDDIYQGHKIAKTAAEAAAIAIKSGLNLECGSTLKALRQALDQGLVSEADLDRALLPLMTTRLRLGIAFNDPDCPYNLFGEEVIGQQSHIDLALRAAQESMVLLKNDGVLPLSKQVRTLFVAGPGATDIYYLMGNYYGVSNHYSTFLQGIVDKVSAGTTINYKQGFMPMTHNLNAVDWSIDDARSADITVLVMGNNGNTEGEEGDAIASDNTGDRSSLTLSEPQMTYLRKIGQNHKNKIIIVLTGGSPIDLREINQYADAVVMAWYPGQEGGLALGDLLFGDANFSGRLPITFPVDAALLPPFDDYTMQGRTYRYTDANTLYPFGYGLSYGKVEYSDLSIVGKPNPKQGVTATVTLTNPSNYDLTETAQVYVSVPTAGGEVPLRQLVGFQRVELKAGESRTVTFSIPTARLQTIQADGTPKLLKGNYTLTISAAAPCARSEQLGVSMVSTTFKM
ncbi:MAG: glycoside hydrolase family 3 C-terminal domain-containing protein [Bacteroidales bacterium]|nr:glycoside hydrolase family 3 C-terminal domain-containing protein [Bacteroidales bacterium]